jgi:hypothetical protein
MIFRPSAAPTLHDNGHKMSGGSHMLRSSMHCMDTFETLYTYKFSYNEINYSIDFNKVLS